MTAIKKKKKHVETIHFNFFFFYTKYFLHEHGMVFADAISVTPKILEYKDKRANGAKKYRRFSRTWQVGP